MQRAELEAQTDPLHFLCRMYSSIAALVLLGFALAWTALNKSGILPLDWYVSLVFIGLAFLAFWCRSRRVLGPALPKWLIWTITGVLLYFVFQAIPLPLFVLEVLSPARAEFTRALVRATGPVTSAPISVDPAAHILWLLTIAGCTGVFFLVRDLTFRFQKRLVVAILPVFLVAVFEAILGLLQVAGGAPEAIGSYNGRDHYCCILELTLPLTIAFGLFFLGSRSKAPSLWPVIRAIACWFAAGLLTLGILFSLSRAGWVDSLLSLVLLAILVLLPRMPSKGWRIGTVTALVVAMVAVFLVASPEAMLARLAGTLTPDSEGRIYIWRELVPLIREFRWFGSGLMGFDPLFLKYQAVITWKRIDFAHNDFLQYLIEMGLVGFIPLMITLGAIISPVARGSWLSQSEKRPLLIGCVASLFALFVHSLVDFNLYVPANLFTFAWILGFGSALASIANSGGDSLTTEGNIVPVP